MIDLAVQAIDGFKIPANAARDRNYDAAKLHRLLERIEKAIADMAAQNEGGDGPSPPKLPEELQRAQILRQQIRDAVSYLKQNETMKRVNLTDEDAQLMKGRDGIITGYNVQAMVSPLVVETGKGGGILITAADLVNTASDSGQLIPMLEKAEELTGNHVPVTLTDGGYHTVANLEAREHGSQTLVMAERYKDVTKDPYFEDQFVCDTTTDKYVCPQGHLLHFRGLRKSKRLNSGQTRVYCASRTICRTCPAFGIGTKDAHAGRALSIGPSDLLLSKHRQWMKTDEARLLYARRQQLCEPTIGILKEIDGSQAFST